MERKDIESQVIESYKKDEQMMILVFAQWCINHELDPEELYIKAYPEQVKNPALHHALELTVPKTEAGEIADETLFNVLDLFGNHDLAFIVQEEIEKRKQS
ncbi:hypothetical protein QR721_02495 [Aciduricibacillus chroicocephali]|uniref:YxiS n=1 Tax=Aciduricibacillus chroicocephali TaxID=3054939 RepID=A0ABY9KW70_9BACI|nr:hypothetical protein QR721_02495 [Bacillaceae bacterium 44XB]